MMEAGPGPTLALKKTMTSTHCLQRALQTKPLHLTWDQVPYLTHWAPTLRPAWEPETFTVWRTHSGCLWVSQDTASTYLAWSRAQAWALTGGPTQDSAPAFPFLTWNTAFLSGAWHRIRSSHSPPLGGSTILPDHWLYDCASCTPTTSHFHLEPLPDRGKQARRQHALHCAHLGYDIYAKIDQGSSACQEVRNKTKEAT